MTATLTGQQLPDPITVLKRVDERLAKRAGDDPLPAETITAFADAVQRQLIEPLSAGAVPPDRDASALTAERDMLRSQLAAAETDTREATATVEQLRHQLAAKDNELDTARAERDTANGRVRDLETELAAARKDADTWESEYERVRDDQLVELVEAKEALDTHTHTYPWTSPGDEPGPCDCGKPWPRALVEVEENEPAPEPQAWEQLRAELIALGFPEVTA